MDQVKKKKKKTGKIILGILILLILLALGATATLFAMKSRGAKAAVTSDDSNEEIKSVEEAIVENSGKTVNYKGETYMLNEDLSTILFMGVDRDEYREDDNYGHGGQADSLFLAVINHVNGEITMIPISRNTMVEIDKYNGDGNYIGQDQIQLALAYAYGDGKEESCKNVAKAVSRMMYGMPVNQYLTIDISCIQALNDGIGGVEVTVLEDLTEKDPVLEKGAVVTLNGSQAETYVRSREHVLKDGEENKDNNAARMERQKQYVVAFMKKALKETKKKPLLPLNLFNSLKDDILTDITPSEIIYYVSLMNNNGLKSQMLSIPGEVKHNEFTEVYPDKEALYELILDTFYEKQ